MGRGNVRVFNEFEEVYYVPFEEFEEKSYDFEKDEYDEESEKEFKDYLYDDFKENLYSYFTTKFKSFSKPFEKKWIGREDFIVAENKLYYLTLCDNEWSIAVKLLQKENSYYENYTIDGLQKKHFESYKNGLLKTLFDISSEVYGYNGPWTSKKLENEAKRK